MPSDSLIENIGHHLDQLTGGAQEQRQVSDTSTSSIVPSSRANATLVRVFLTIILVGFMESTIDGEQPTHGWLRLKL